MMLRKIALAVLLSLLVLPIAYLIALSLAGEWRYPQLWPSEWTLQHWHALGGQGEQWLFSAIQSLWLAFMVGLMATTAGFLTAHRLAAHPKRALWLALAYVPYAFSPVIYAHCLKFFFNVTELSGTVGGVLLAQFILTYPFAFLLFVPHFDQTLRAMENLARTLGSSNPAVFWRVLVPVSRTSLLICFFQTFLISWFEYGLSSVIGLGQVRTLPLAVYQYIGEANQYIAALSSVLICLPPLLLLWLNQRFIFRPSNI